MTRTVEAAGITALAAAASYLIDPPARWAGVPLLVLATVVVAWRCGQLRALAAAVVAALWLTQQPLHPPAWLAGITPGQVAALAYVLVALLGCAAWASLRPAAQSPAFEPAAGMAWRERHAQLVEAVGAAGLWAWAWNVDTGLVDIAAAPDAGSDPALLSASVARIDVRDCLARVHEDDRAAVQQAVEAGARRVQCRVLARDGRVVWMQAQGKLVRGAEGQPRMAYGVLENIDERKRAEAEQAGSERRKDQFLAIVGHELRNPLNPMAAALQVLKEKGEDGEMRAWARVLIERQVRHLARLLDDLLDVSRLAHGKFALRREAVDICSLIGAAIDGVRADIDGKRQRVEFHVGRLEPVYVDGDAVRLTQIVSNLVTNAMKYSPAGSTITVRVGARGQDVEITVSDTGIGIPQEELERVFDLFAQSPTGSKFSGDGLGIGLYLVRGLVEMHGGRITAHSGGVGKGSTFSVTLPRAHPPQGAETQAHNGYEARDFGPLRVVVADDNADSVDTLAVLLRLQGHEVRTASHGGEALELILQFRPQVAVLDIGMPVLNGYDVARRVRRQLPDTLLIAVSGWGNSDDVMRARDAGFDHHIVKPADFARLERLITRARPARRGEGASSELAPDGQ